MAGKQKIITYLWFDDNAEEGDGVLRLYLQGVQREWPVGSVSHSLCS